MVGLQACSTCVDKALIHTLCFNGVSKRFVLTSADTHQGPNSGKLKSNGHLAIDM